MLPAAADVQATCCATLVDQWVRDGLVHAVIAPGSRSTPMALAFAAHPDVRVHVVHDERAAGFVALGIGAELGAPAAVLCTSGTAATHLVGAVAEASLSCVPMLVLTANRPPELIDVGAPQAIDQTKLFGAAVRWFHDPGVPAREAAHTWRALARQSFAATAGANPGPVHLDLPFREPLVGTAGDLPRAYLGKLAVPTGGLRLGTLAMELERERGVIVAGRGVDDPAAVQRLAAATGWPILADPRSGCRGLPAAVGAFDAILRHEELAGSHLPEVVVHLGEPPASKVLAQWTAAAGGVQVRVEPTPRIIDPSHTITHRVTAEIGACCARLAGELRGATASGATGAGWTQRWGEFERIAQDVLRRTLCDDAPVLTEPHVSRIATEQPGTLVVASSMPIRDVEWYGAPSPAAIVRANRGANGIDGTVSTAIGVALATGGPVTVLLGDIALLHDSSALTGLAARGIDVRIVVVDNDGGGIFSFLPQATSIATERFEQLFGTPHGTDLLALGAAHRLRTADVTTPAALRAAIAEPGPSLTRVVTDRAQNVAAHRALHDEIIAALDAPR